MQVKAIAPGVDDKGHYRKAGDIFPCPKRANGSEITQSEWYVPVEEKKPQAKGKPNDDGDLA